MRAYHFSHCVTIAGIGYHILNPFIDEAKGQQRVEFFIDRTKEGALLLNWINFTLKINWCKGHLIITIITWNIMPNDKGSRLVGV